MRRLLQWLPLFSILSLLTACGSGGEESSSLLFEPERPVDTSTPTPVEDKNTVFMIEGRQIIPVGETSTTITLTTFEDFDTSTQTIAEVPVLPSVPFTVSVTGAATLPDGKKSLNIITDSRGQASFTIHYPAGEHGNPLCSISGRENYKGGTTFPLYFGGTVESTNIGANTVPADGKTGIGILISARDGDRIPITSTDVKFSFSAGSFAVPAVTGGLTNSNGEFSTTITDTVPQSVAVIPVVGGLASNSLKLNFEAIGLSVAAPASLDLIVKSNNVYADGQAQAVLVGVARDATGIPINNVPVNLSSSSATATLKIGERTGTLSLLANTGDSGSFELAITNTVAETLTISAVTSNGTTSLSATQDVVFAEVPETSQVVPKNFTLRLDKAINNFAVADGTAAVSLRGKVTDDKGNPPLESQKVIILVGGGSAKITPEVSQTDSSGRFFADLTDTVVEGFKAWAVLGDLKSNEVDVNFKAVPAEPTVTEPEEITPAPQSITLFAIPEKQVIAEGNEITLTAIARDSAGTPMSDVNLAISASGNTANTAVFDSGLQTTDAGGNAIFTVSNPVAGVFTVYARAVDADGKALGVQSNNKQLEFTVSTPDVVKVEVEELIVNVVKNNQLANGTDAVQVDVITRNKSGQAAGSIPVTLQMSAGASAVADPAKLVTNDSGFAQTNITSTQVGDVALTFTVEGANVTHSPVIITFIAAQAADQSTALKNVQLDVQNSPQPADGKAGILLIVKPLDSKGTPVADADIEIITDSLNVKGTLSGKTNALGEFRTTLTSEVAAENIKVTPVAKIGETGKLVGEAKTISFVAVGSEFGEKVKNLTVSVLNDNQLANGKDEIQIVAIVRDIQNRVVVGVPVVVEMPADTPAVANPASKTTDDKGLFETKISSVYAGKIPVTIVVDTTALRETVDITFKTETQPEDDSIKINDIEVQVLHSPQPADGKAEINLTAIPRGVKTSGETTTPLPDTNIEFVSEPEGLKFTPGPTGKTNSLGKYPVTVTSEKAGTFKITPLAWAEGDETAKFTDDPVEIVFKSIGSKVVELAVDVVKDNQKVGDAVEMAVVARDERGVGLAAVPINVQIATGSKAVADPASGLTDNNGYFTTKITSTEAGAVTVTISVEDTDVAHPPVNVHFVTGEDSSVARVELQVLNAPQTADDTAEIVLVVRAFDEKGEPLPEKDVELIADSDKITIAKATGKTNALGEYRTTAKSKVAGSYQVTPLAGGVKGTAVPVVFIPLAIPLPHDLTLTVTGNNQEAGASAVLTVLARDEQRVPVENVPVIIRVTPGDEPPDVTGSVIFEGNGFKGKTNDKGIFETSVKNSRPGSFKVQAFVDGTSLNSAAEVITFKGTTTETPDVAKLELIASSPQLLSAGWQTDSKEAVIITAILRNKSNNLVPDIKVDFEVDSGEIQLVEVSGDTVTPKADAVSDATGRVYARLTTRGNPDNRTITVKAVVAATVNAITGPVEDTITIEVTGTTLTVSGSTSITTGDSTDLTTQLLDSDKKGIAGRQLNLESALGNVFSNSSPTTDSAGRAIVKFTANVPGQDTLTVSKQNVPPATLSVFISDDHFKLESSPAGITQIPLDKTQEFVVSWFKGNSPQVNQLINLNTSRGELSSQSVLTDFNGEGRFTIKANDLGRAVITANVAGGPTTQLEVIFMTTQADSMVLQATPSTIGVNLPGAEEQTSEISAVVRLRDNLVPGIKVNFTLNDPTGGRLSPAFKVTDESGRATVQYIAGGAPSASNSVVVTASVEGVSTLQCKGTEAAPPNGCMTRLTVALKQAFISLGTGNSIEKVDPVWYKHPYTALVTDVNGAPIADMEIVLSVIPTRYRLGVHVFDEVWTPQYTGNCPNEDVNLNGILDPGEDKNLTPSGSLEPGNVVTFIPAESTEASTTSTGSTVKVKTGKDGFASFSLLYAKEYAYWVEIKLMARVAVSGSEDTDDVSFVLWGEAADYSAEDKAPPGYESPYNNYPCTQ